MVRMRLRDLVYRLYEHRLEASLSPQAIPRHVGVMCDGNRRWATWAGLPDVSGGYQKGADKIFEHPAAGRGKLAHQAGRRARPAASGDRRRAQGCG
jgi:hypothetical protein